MKKNNIKIPVSLYLDECITRRDLSAYSALYYLSEKETCENADESHRICKASLTDIQRISRMTLPIILKAIKSLNELGYIITKKSGFNKPTEYVLVDEKLIKYLRLFRNDIKHAKEIQEPIIIE